MNIFSSHTHLLNIVKHIHVARSVMGCCCSGIYAVLLCSSESLLVFYSLIYVSCMQAECYNSLVGSA